MSANRETKEHVVQLRGLHACIEAVVFAEDYDSLELAWRACERGDWMLWLIGQTVKGKPWSNARKPLLACALDCAETVKELWPEGQKQIMGEAVAVLRRWIDGKVSVEEAIEARRQLRAAYAYADVVAAAAAATATVAADVVAAAYAAAVAADVAAAAYADVAYADVAAAARKAKQKECADIVRRHFPHPPEVSR